VFEFFLINPVELGRGKERGGGGLVNRIFLFVFQWRSDFNNEDTNSKFTLSSCI